MSVIREISWVDRDFYIFRIWISIIPFHRSVVSITPESSLAGSMKKIDNIDWKMPLNGEISIILGIEPVRQFLKRCQIYHACRTPSRFPPCRLRGCGDLGKLRGAAFRLGAIWSGVQVWNMEHLGCCGCLMSLDANFTVALLN